MLITADCNPRVLEAVLQAEAVFARLLLDAAPMPDGDTKNTRHLERQARYDRYMPSHEVRAIASFLYMLRAYGVTNGEALRRLIEAHNTRIDELATDTNYLYRMRISRPRLVEAKFSENEADHAIGNFNRGRGIAMDATTMGRLLVEFANKHQVAEAMELLTWLGFFNQVKGAYNANVRFTTGRLEDIYEAYLTHLAQDVSAAVEATKHKRSLKTPLTNGGDAE
jgi:hypothetical protein